jgi:hypothetical protein
MTKLPLYNHKRLPPLTTANGQVTESTGKDKEYLSYFKSMLDMADYEFLFKVAAQVAEGLELPK